MEWRHRARPKEFRGQKSAGKFLSSIFWDQEGNLLIDYLPKGQAASAEYYSSPLVQIKDILKERRRGKVTKGVLFLHYKAPLTGHLQPGSNWPTWTSNVLINHPILRIWPRRTTTCSLDWKKQRPGWTDNILIFFEWLANG